jgi:hypothetical protein
MNIDGDYLWDKTGEADPEIQELEEILGTLRYQPQPWEIDKQTDPRRNLFSGIAPRLAIYIPRLAIAATIAVALLGLGLWLGLQRVQRRPSPNVANTPNTPAANSSPASATVSTTNHDQNDNQLTTSPALDQKHTDGPRRHRVNAALLARNAKRARENRQSPQLALREGRAAKDQLMLALRLASAKLNFAQKKTQNTNPRDQVHNQHKIG